VVFLKGEKRTRGELPRVLVVDDEADIRELIDLTLSRMGLAADCVGSVAEALSAIDQESYALCLTDMRLPDGEGLDVVRYIGLNSPATPVAVITAYGSTDNAISAMKAGAFDYLAKPVGLEALRTLVRSALPITREDRATSTARLIGTSGPMDLVREMIGKLARSQAPVCVTGESGTGKELASRLIHQNGSRAAAPFVPVNCGAIPDSLMESEFFGYRKGAFTGALEDRDGFFQTANGGTLFLDEVADLPLPMQVKLLRAIQERRVRKVGSASEEPVDVRIISATHRDLKMEMEAGKFRQDLFYRLNVIELRMPALRERSEDIPLLVSEILARNGGDVAITPESNFALSKYDFPGNVRELENILERAVALCSDRVIRLEDLQISPLLDRETPGEVDGGLQAMLDRIERQAIVDALAQTNGNRTAAARVLGVTFRSLRYRIERLGVEVE
jgi:two-component system, NtrC family, response regulator PilR